MIAISTSSVGLVQDRPLEVVVALGGGVALAWKALTAWLAGADAGVVHFPAR